MADHFPNKEQTKGIVTAIKEWASDIFLSKSDAGNSINTSEVTTDDLTVTSNIKSAPNSNAQIGSSNTPFGSAYINNIYYGLGKTKLESKGASSEGTTTSLVTTGEKYIWNNKADKGYKSVDITLSRAPIPPNAVDEAKNRWDNVYSALHNAGINTNMPIWCRLMVQPEYDYSVAGYLPIGIRPYDTSYREAALMGTPFLRFDNRTTDNDRAYVNAILFTDGHWYFQVTGFNSSGPPTLNVRFYGFPA